MFVKGCFEKPSVGRAITCDRVLLLLLGEVVHPLCDSKEMFHSLCNSRKVSFISCVFNRGIF